MTVGMDFLCFRLLFLFNQILKANKPTLSCFADILSRIKLFPDIFGPGVCEDKNGSTGSLFLDPPPHHSWFVHLRGDSCRELSKQLRFSLIFSLQQSVWSRPLHFSNLTFKSVFPLSAFFSMIFHDHFSLSLSSGLGPLVYPLFLLCFLKFLSVFPLSPAVLHSCFSRDGGGQGRRKREGKK